MALKPKKTASRIQVTTAKQSAPDAKMTAKKTAKMKAEPVVDAAKTGEELVIENFAALSSVVDTFADTLEMLVQKVESMAYHIVATEEVLAELVAANGLNLARVNARIRSKISAAEDNGADSGKAIDIAAAIASPLPRR